MAVLKDLIVHGRSRFINGAQFNTINAESIGATEGIFNKLIATTLEAKEATIDDLTATNATIVGLLDVQGEMHTKSWSNSNIATIDGNFYITPTVVSADGADVTASGYTPTGTLTYSSGNYTQMTIAGTFDTSQLTLDDVSSIDWPANSYVIITGEVSIGKEWYPLGTIRGKLGTSIAKGTGAAAKSITIVPIGTQIISGEVGNVSLTDGNGHKPSTLEAIRIAISETSGASLNSLKLRKIKISMTSRASGNDQYALGIYMTAMGSNKKTFLDIYGGSNKNGENVSQTISDITYQSGALAVPTVRIGNLLGLPMVGGITPKGWGIYTNNGFFTGTIVARQGKIGNADQGAWTIGNDSNTGAAYIYTGNLGASPSAYVSTGYGTISIANSGALTGNKKWVFTAGDKFGVTNEGDLYASNATINGDIIAQSLTIGNGANAYSGIAAINITGYSIEIEVADIAGSTETKKLIPHLLHNGQNADTEVIDKTDFIWYVDNSTSGIQGDSVDGSITGAYGSSYQVIYDFDDGAVEGGTATRTLTVDPSKYITRISDTGITIHPEVIISNLKYVQIDGNGLKIKKTINNTIDINNDIVLANYGDTITIGQSNSKNVFIDSNGVNIKNGSTILSNFGETITIGQSGNKNVFIDSNGVNIKSGSDILANFGNTITIGQNISGHTVINSNGMEIFTDINTSVANFRKENNSFKIRIGLENDTRTEITPTSFLAVNAESVEGFKIEMDAPGLSYPVSITPEGPITSDNYVTETYGIAPLGQQLSVSDCESEWATTKTVTSITNVSSNATANFDYSSGEYTVTLAKVDSNDYIFGTDKNEILSATVNFSDNTTQTIQFTISYSSPRTWTFQATATTSLLEFRIMKMPTVTYDLEVSTALTSGIRTYGSAKGAFSSVIGEELIATTEAHAAFGRYNNDTLVSPHYLIASFGKGKSELYRSNAAAIGFYKPDYHDEIASIYLSLDEAIWLSFMDEAPEPSNIDAEIIEAMGNLGWINYDPTTQDFSNKSGSYMLADYSDRSNE